MSARAPALVAALVGLVGCGAPAPTPSAEDGEALTALLGAAPVFYATNGPKPDAQTRAGLRDGRVVQLRVATPVANPGALQRLGAVENLTLDGAGWTGPLHCPELQALSVRRNPGFQYAWLAGCRRLRSLELTDSELTDVVGFPGLPELRTLHLNGNPIESLAALPPMPKLERIVLDGARPGAEETVSAQPALRGVVTPQTIKEAATARATPTPTPKTVFPRVVGGVTVPAPTNPWVERIEGSSGSRTGAKRNCTTSTTGSLRLDCTFSFSRLKGIAYLPLSLGNTNVRPAVRATLEVGGGGARVYMPYFGVHQYAEASGGGGPVEITGVLQRSTRGTGKNGEYELVIQAPDSATDVVVRLTHQ